VVVRECLRLDQFAQSRAFDVPHVGEVEHEMFVPLLQEASNRAGEQQRAGRRSS